MSYLNNKDNRQIYLRYPRQNIQYILNTVDFDSVNFKESILKFNELNFTIMKYEYQIKTVLFDLSWLDRF